MNFKQTDYVKPLPIVQLVPLIDILFVTLSFFVAALHSYFWNHSWVFRDSARGGSAELTKFFVVTIIAAIKASDGARYRYPLCIHFIK